MVRSEQRGGEETRAYSTGSTVKAITLGAVSSGPLTNSIRSIVSLRFSSVAREKSLHEELSQGD